MSVEVGERETECSGPDMGGVLGGSTKKTTPGQITEDPRKTVDVMT